MTTIIKSALAAAAIVVTIPNYVHAFVVNGKTINCSSQCVLPYVDLLKDPWAKEALRAFFLHKGDTNSAAKRLQKSANINEQNPLKKRKLEKELLAGMIANYQSLKGKVRIMVEGTLGDSDYHFETKAIIASNIILREKVKINKPASRWGWRGDEFAFCKGTDNYVISQISTACAALDVYHHVDNSRMRQQHITGFRVPENIAETFFETQRKLRFQFEVARAKTQIGASGVEFIYGGYQKVKLELLNDDGSLLYLWDKR